MLSYRPGGEVERVGSLSADALTVRPARPRLRTVPATVANLRPGATVMTHAPISSEDDAHLRWDVDEVERVDAARGVIVLGGAGAEPIAQAPVPVVTWFPGGRASAVE